MDLQASSALPQMENCFFYRIRSFTLRFLRRTVQCCAWRSPAWVSVENNQQFSP